MPEKKQKDFQRETIKVLREVEDGERGTEIAIVRWIVDGRAYSPVLINQEVYHDRIAQQRKHGKMKGWTLGDFKFISDRSKEIIEYMADLYRNPKAVNPPVTGKEAAANDVAEMHEDRGPRTADEEVPF